MASCLVSNPGNSANTDLIRQAKEVRSYSWNKHKVCKWNSQLQSPELRTFKTINGSHGAPIMMDFRDLRARKNVLMTLLHECAKNSAKNACQSGKEMVFCFQNWSDLLWEKIVVVIEKKLLKFESESRELANILRSLEQFIQIEKRSEQFVLQNPFLTYSWRFFRSND